MSDKLKKLLSSTKKDDKWKEEVKHEINMERNQNVLKFVERFNVALKANQEITHNERDAFINKITNEHERLLYRFELDLYDDEP